MAEQQAAEIWPTWPSAISKASPTHSCSLSLHYSREFVRNRREATRDGRAEPRAGFCHAWEFRRGCAPFVGEGWVGDDETS